MTESPVTERKRFIPLGRKFNAAILGVTTLALVLSLALSVFPMFHFYRQDAQDKAQALAGLMAASSAAALDFEDPEAAAENLGMLRRVPSVTGAAVFTAEGRLFAAYRQAPAFFAVHEPQALMELNALTVAQPMTTGARPGVLILRISLDGQWEALAGKLAGALVLLLVVFAVAVSVTRFYRRRLTDPLLRIQEVVEDIARNKNYAQRVAYASNDEIGMLVAEFNAMLDKIEQHDQWLNRQQEYLEGLVEQRTSQLLSNQEELERKNRQLQIEIRERERSEMIRSEVERINRHDLKSTLNLVIGYPELLLREGGLTGEQEDHIRRIRSAGYRMLDMIRNHLDMFKMEKGIYSLRKGPVDLVEILCSLEEEFTPLLRGQGVTLSILLDGKEIEGSETFVVSGESALLRAMLRNLMQNAIEASDRGGAVRISLERGALRRVSIHNGRAVPAEIRRRIFEKYVTHGKEGGTGLGTYFAALVAQTHGAHIVCKTDERSGTTMTVSFRDDGQPVSGPEA
jgi:signal transduction histidine kinase